MWEGDIGEGVREGSGISFFIMCSILVRAALRAGRRQRTSHAVLKLFLNKMRSWQRYAVASGKKCA